MSEQTDGPGDLPELDPVEQRILGSLLEKERTVPASYPMTLNGLRTACNQSSSRDPVMDLDERTIEAALGALKARGLTRMVYASSGARAVKYRQVLDEHLGLTSAERAVLTVLLLRGPQAAGELKTRTERLHGFADRDEVEVLLRAMAAAPEPWSTSSSGSRASRTTGGSTSSARSTSRLRSGAAVRRVRRWIARWCWPMVRSLAMPR
ncbi:DUF480 domain-containing protein [Aquihabitans daechungensis]|uniref:DUF480 domain-containing protein n=1 Tax=Aquihabitans daechungensis TaxID=1052257 RepID=UPI003BA36FB2